MTSLNITSVGILILFNCVSHELWQGKTRNSFSCKSPKAVRTFDCGEAQHRAQSVAAQNPENYKHNKGILWISHDIVWNKCIHWGPQKFEGSKSPASKCGRCPWNHKLPLDLTTSKAYAISSVWFCACPSSLFFLSCLSCWYHPCGLCPWESWEAWHHQAGQIHSSCRSTFWSSCSISQWRYWLGPSKANFWYTSIDLKEDCSSMIIYVLSWFWFHLQSLWHTWGMTRAVESTMVLPWLSSVLCGFLSWAGSNGT